MYESGLSTSTVPNKPPNVFSTKGERCVNSILSADRGTSVTVVCVINASEHIIFHRQIHQ